MGTYLKVFPQPRTKRHRFGVTSLAFGSKDYGNILYSAGRDTSIRGYDLANTKFSSDSDADVANYTVLTGHSDWVNDIHVLTYSCEDRIASASSDGLVKIWHPNNGCLQTLTGHTDYVKSLAPTRDHRLLSGGLDQHIKLWDLYQGTCVLDCGATFDNRSSNSSSSSSGSTDFDSTPSTGKSVYTLHAARDTTEAVVASGHGNNVVLWDIRTGRRATTLRAHTDMVRCVQLRRDALVVLSGGSDNCVMLHDVRREGVLQTFQLHDDSVWALQAVDEWSAFYSGGRDGRVCRCELRDEGAAVVVRAASATQRRIGRSGDDGLGVEGGSEEGNIDDSDGKMFERVKGAGRDMVLSVVGDASDEAAVWISTTSSTIWRYAARGSGSPRSIRDVLAVTRGHGYGYVVSDKKEERTGPNGCSTNTVTQRHLEGSDATPRPTGRIDGEVGITHAAPLNNRRHIVTRDGAGQCAKVDVLTGLCVRRYDSGVTMEQALAVEFEEVSVPSWFTVELRSGGVEVRVDVDSCFNADVFSSDVGLTGVGGEDDERVNMGELLLHNVFFAWREGRKVKTGGDNEKGAVEGSGEQQRQAELLSGRYASDGEVGLFDAKTGHEMVRWECSDVESMREAKLPKWVSDAIVDGVAEREEGKGKSGKVSFTVEALIGGRGEAEAAKLLAPRFMRVVRVKEYVAQQLNNGSLRPLVVPAHVTIWCKGATVSETMSIGTCAQFVWAQGGTVHLHYTVEM